MKTIRIATRQSKLALWQAGHVKGLIESRHRDVCCEIVGMTTEGDRNQSSPLTHMAGKRSGKGVFVKELELALLDGSADIAVHSMKDVPGELPDGLMIAATCARADPRDALVSNDFGSVEALPQGAVVGSSSLRRCLQIGRRFPQLRFEDLRGNVDTRLRKLDEGRYDAVVLAVAGLERLQLAHRISQKIPTNVSIPAAGQGAVGVESRVDDAAINSLLRAIGHSETQICVFSERLVTHTLGATCNLPVAVFASIDSGEISIASFVADIRGKRVITEAIRGQSSKAAELSHTLGQRLIDQGAKELIDDSAHRE